MIAFQVQQTKSIASLWIYKNEFTNLHMNIIKYHARTALTENKILSLILF